MKTVGGNQGNRPGNVKAEIRAARLARRADFSLCFGLFALILFALFWVQTIDGGIVGAILPLVCALALAALAIGSGMAAAGRESTSNRGRALAGMILGDLVVTATLAFLLWELEQVVFGLVIILGGSLLWLTFDVYFRGGWVREPRDASTQVMGDDVLENRLLRRAQWSAVSGIVALFLAGLFLALYLAYKSLRGGLPDIPYIEWSVVAWTLVIASIAMGSIGCILASAARQDRGTPGNSLAWVGTILGVLSVGACVIVLFVAD